MLENATKTTYFHASALGRRQLLQAGARGDRIMQDPCVLGVHFRGRQLRLNTPKEEARLTAAVKLLRRCALLPVSWACRKRVVSTQCLGKDTWGWVFRLPPKQDRERVNSAVRVALREGKNASVQLRALLRGHSLDFDFRVLSAHVAAAQKQAWRRRGFPCAWARRGWSQVMQSAMQALGWTLLEPWLWLHERLSFTLRIASDVDHQAFERSMHCLRESWRHCRFNAFMCEDRRDSAACRAAFVAYDEAVVARARKACTSFQRFQAMRLSPAARCRWHGPDPGVCASCGREPATLDHLLWRCVALPNRPVTRNLGILQARFGWPSGRANDVAILE